MINHYLRDFGKEWNHHEIRTARGQTPNQLFFRCRLEAARLGIDILADPLALVPDEGEDMEWHRAQEPASTASGCAITVLRRPANRPDAQLL